MSVDYEGREKQYEKDIQASFRSLTSLVTIEAEMILKHTILAYKADLRELDVELQRLQDLDSKYRVVEDIIAITKIGEADANAENKYRKIRQALVAKGLVEN